jgi:predicted metal-dependent HD superfamily phosphohydrolase
MHSAPTNERVPSMRSKLSDTNVAEAVWVTFKEVWDEAGLDPKNSYLAFETIRLGYTLPDRHYHDFHHILYGLHQFQRTPLLVDEAGDELLAVKLAWVYHDVYYDPSAPKGENELKSADIAHKAILDAGDLLIADLVHDLIMVTVHDYAVPPTTPAGKVIADIDLMSMSDGWPDFEEDSWRIREEYRSVVPDDVTFWKKWAGILQTFLDRERLYYTDVCRAMFEVHARANLERAIREA